jgi:HEAT repeat protein
MNPLVRNGVRLLPVVIVAAIAYTWTTAPPRSIPPAPNPPAIQRWTPLLQSSSVEKRREAAAALLALGPDAQPAAAALVGALKDKDATVQRTAGRALLEIGPPAGPALTAALLKDNRTLRFAAACVLSQVDPSSPAGVPVLIDALKEKPQRIEAAAALVRIGPPALPGLTAALTDPNPAVRRDAADILRDLGPRAKSAAPALAKALEDEDPHVRLAVVRALGAVGADAKEVVPALLACATEIDPQLRQALPEAPPTPKVLRYSATLGSRLRQEVTEALAKFGPAGVPVLAAALQHEPMTCRAAAARALGQLGPLAKPASGALTAALTDPVPQVRWEAARALVALGQTDAVVPMLAEGLRDRDFRFDALRALLQCGPGGRAALIAALQDKDEVVRGETARALGQVGLEAKDAIPALIDTLKDPDRTVRREAAHALGRIGVDANLSVPALIPVLKDSWAVNRGEAAIALSRLGPMAKDAVPALIANLTDESLDASQEAAKALVEIGPAALPALREAANGPDAAIARAAAEVVRQIAPKAGE